MEPSGGDLKPYSVRRSRSGMRIRAGLLRGIYVV
jgi:hypothetical protein